MEKKRSSRLALPFFLNLGFSALELVGGLLTNSVAILSDSVHDLGDSISIGMSWLMDLKARKKPTSTYTFGYARYSLLGALLTSLVLLAGSFFVILEAVRRLLNPEPVNAGGMIGLAIAGILVNGFAAFTSHRGKSLNEKAVSLHLFEDVFGWVAVLAGAVAMALWDLPFLDSLLSLGFTGFILFEAGKNLKAIIEVFLEKAPGGVDFEPIRKRLLETEGVLGIHHVHLWTLEGRIHLVTLHAVIPEGTPEATYLAIQNELRGKLAAAGLKHATIEIEYGIGECRPSDFETEGYCPEEDEHEH